MLVGRHDFVQVQTVVFHVHLWKPMFCVEGNDACVLIYSQYRILAMYSGMTILLLWEILSQCTVVTLV